MLEHDPLLTDGKLQDVKVEHYEVMINDPQSSNGSAQHQQDLQSHYNTLAKLLRPPPGLQPLFLLFFTFYTLFACKNLQFSLSTSYTLLPELSCTCLEVWLSMQRTILKVDFIHGLLGVFQ